jgi:hypothetical protein
VFVEGVVLAMTVRTDPASSTVRTAFREADCPVYLTSREMTVESDSLDMAANGTGKASGVSEGW